MIGCAYFIARMVLNIMLPLIFGLRCEGHFRFVAQLCLACGSEQSAPGRLGSLMAPAAGMEAMGFTNGGGYEYGRYSVCTFPGKTECPESM